MSAIPVALGMGVLKKIAAQAASSGASAANQASGLSKEIFGYDFIALITKLTIFYVVAYLFAKFMEAIIYGGNFLNSFVLGAGSLFGLKIPKKEVFPKVLVDLFIDGYGPQKIVYWDIVKSLSLALVIFEAIQYLNANKKVGADPSPFTIGIFTLIVGAIAVVTIPDIFKRGKPYITLSTNDPYFGHPLTIGLVSFAPGNAFYGWKRPGAAEPALEVPILIGSDGSATFDVTIGTPLDVGDWIIYARQDNKYAETKLDVHVEIVPL